jgi:hypothetical protein
MLRRSQDHFCRSGESVLYGSSGEFALPHKFENAKKLFPRDVNFDAHAWGASGRGLRYLGALCALFSDRMMPRVAL